MNMQSKLGKGGNKMDKDRILEQVRTENIDEGVEHIKNKGLGIGYMIFLALSITIMIFNLFTGQKTYSVQSLFWGFIAAEKHSLYRFSGDKSNKFGLYVLVLPVWYSLLIIFFIVWVSNYEKRI